MDQTVHESSPPRSAEELLRRYAAGARDFCGVELAEGSSLRGARLDGASFDQGFLSDVDVRGASLRGASFCATNVKCSDFRAPDLTGARFRDASVEAILVTGALLDGAEFAGAHAYGHTIADGEVAQWLRDLAREWPGGAGAMGHGDTENTEAFKLNLCALCVSVV